jgi:hypothetical protein
VSIGSVPAGRWRLRIEPRTPLTTMSYTVTVRESGPRFGWMLLMLLLLAPAWWLAHLWAKANPVAPPRSELG